MIGEEFRELCDSIDGLGQQEPITVLNGVLIDGRNRARACEALKITPKVQQFNSPLRVVEFIMMKNLDRRNLTPEQKATAYGQAYRMMIAESNTARKTQSGAHGIEGGRGHKKPETLNTNSSEGFTEPKTRAMNERSTVGQIAKNAKVSYHKARQVVAVTEKAPELAKKVIAGEMKLKDAAKQVQARKEVKTGTRHKHGDRKPESKSADLHTTPGIMESYRRFCDEVQERLDVITGKRGPRSVWRLDKVNKLKLIHLLDWVQIQLEQIGKRLEEELEAKEKQACR
jgi:hypothetical protein